MGRYTPMEGQIIERLVTLLQTQRQPVRAVHVFGSRARGRSHADLDLDLAIELTAARTLQALYDRRLIAKSQGLSASDRRRSGGELGADTHTHTGPERCDKLRSCLLRLARHERTTARARFAAHRVVARQALSTTQGGKRCS
ncbi:MAG: nucleotidyltransferase domain-containing protein [Thiobacillaceae bacterium]|nr:nucleotidyltransferase domain-containing protein [Thiobacillaceae bacterium]MDW8323241.1 nucleotidyltransferase domain-containing protein [Burkholderiales bacterium]